ncbi:MAG: hypothetical protein JXL97_02390 [Bacteroidales bacterium]|nr:hypothetical protein [Bacteroidales bacterium]
MTEQFEVIDKNLNDWVIELLEDLKPIPQIDHILVVGNQIVNYSQTIFPFMLI